MNDENDVFVIGEAAGAVSSYRVKVRFPGESSASTKTYQVLNTSGVAQGVRVLCARVSGSWVVIGALRG